MDYDAIIDKQVHECYWKEDINCARTTIKVLASLFGLTIEEQTLNSAVGLHGAGGYRAQCGIVEGSIMIIGILFKEKYHKADSEIISMIKTFAGLFEKEFGSLRCFDLRPNGFQDNDPPHLCEEITKKGIRFTYKFCCLNQ